MTAKFLRILLGLAAVLSTFTAVPVNAESRALLLANNYGHGAPALILMTALSMASGIQAAPLVVGSQEEARELEGRSTSEASGNSPINPINKFPT
ncbi:hypothetical protein BC835DRAFT_1421108 [Cytidiella melzeri]|nr:hypothetical protein BC835DRAFT_1421108 [Cytidiella melzeri]